MKWTIESAIPILISRATLLSPAGTLSLSSTSDLYPGLTNTFRSLRGSLSLLALLILPLFRSYSFLCSSRLHYLSLSLSQPSRPLIRQPSCESLAYLPPRALTIVGMAQSFSTATAPWLGYAFSKERDVTHSFDRRWLSRGLSCRTY